MTTEPMTLADWLGAQMEQMNNPAYRAGYMAGILEGQRIALERVLETVRQAQLSKQERPDNAS